MNQDLFRVRGEASHLDRYDAFSLRSMRTESRVSWALVAIFLLLLALVALFPYSEVVEARGQIAPVGGVIRIASDRSGVIESYPSRDHENIAKGRVVAVIRGDIHGPQSRSRAGDLVANLQAQIRAVDQKTAAELEAARSRLRHLFHEQSGFAARRSRAEANRRLAGRKVLLAEEGFRRAETLADDRLISKLELGRLEEQLLNAKLALSSAEQDVADSTESIHELDQRIAEAKAQVIAYEQQQLLDVNRIEQEILDSRYSESSQVIAPATGRVTYGNFKEGESVKPGDILASIVPDEQGLRAVAFVPSRSVANIKVGDRVRVMVDSHPYQQYGVIEGVLAEISLAPVDPVREVQPSPADVVSYRVLVNFKDTRFSGSPIAGVLKPGELLSVSIAGESKPVYRWALHYLRNNFRLATSGG